MAKEIERKFILSRLPDIDLGEGMPMEQGYIPLPRRNLTMRVRLEGERRVLTFKGTGETTREEANLDLSEHPEIYALLEENTKGGRIRKTRYRIQDGGGSIEVDLFEGDHLTLQGKLIAEREFDSEDAMKAWQPPEWMMECGAREVTFDGRYRNSALMRQGWPEDA